MSASPLPALPRAWATPSASLTLRGPAPPCPAGLYSFCKALETLETGVLGGFYFKVGLGKNTSIVPAAHRC